MARPEDFQKVREVFEAEFEEFVSVAAHQLREPLRDVASFSQLLAEKYAGRLDAEGAAWLDRIGQGASRMQSLLAGMVAYAEAGIGDLRPGPVDMETVLSQALLFAHPQISARSAVVSHDRLPQVWGDFESLTKVLHHLIRNAIEYCEVTPLVHISSRREDLEWVFSVRDNGPGIEPAFRERIFGVFKRLHGSEHPGAGLGLAFCRKALASQGGRIWLNSPPGCGSVFCFAMPAEE